MSNPAAIYVRLSTDDTKQTSIPRQIEACKAAAVEQGYAVDDRICVDDGYSGYLLERPELDRLLKLVRSHMIEAIFISDADRLSRDYAHDAILRRELLDFHVKLYVGGRPVDTSLDGEMHQSMMAVFASYEGRKIQERMQRGKRWLASQGKALGGLMPLGYRYIPATGDRPGYIEVVAEEAALVQRIFGLYVSGAGIFQIAKQLSDERVPTKTDRDGISRRKTRAYGIWSASTIAKILKNETYHTGAIPWSHYQRVEPDHDKRRGPKSLKNPKTARRIRDQREWLSIPIPPILDADTFEKAQRQIGANKAKNKRRRSHEYLFLNGRMTCFCGRAMTGYCDSKGVRRYRCNSKTDTVSRPCRGVPNASVLEDTIWDALTELLDLLKDPAYLKKYIEQKIATATQEGDHLRQRLENLTRLVAEYARKQQVLLNRHLDGSVDERLFRETMTQLRKESAPLEQLRDEIRGQLLQDVPTEAQILSVSTQVAQILAHLSQATLAEKREVLEAIDARVVRQSNGAYRITFDLPKDMDNDHIKSGSMWIHWGDSRSTSSTRCARSSRP